MGDEYIGFGEGIYGSDSFMITEKTKDGDFYDVSDTEGERPVQVKRGRGRGGKFYQVLRRTKHEIKEGEGKASRRHCDSLSA